MEPIAGFPNLGNEPENGAFRGGGHATGRPDGAAFDEGLNDGGLPCRCESVLSRGPRREFDLQARRYGRWPARVYSSACMNPRSSGKRTVASLQDLWNTACEAASSSPWKAPVPDGVATSTITTCVFSPEPATLVSNKYDPTALRFTNSSNTGVTTLTSAESYAFSWPGRT